MTWTAEDVERVYGSDSWGYHDYSLIVESLGGEVVLQVDDDDYQGDTRVLIRDGVRYGVVIFGWGSCSGCDAHQTANGPGEVAKLRNEIADSVTWRMDARAMLGYFVNHDWEGDWSWHASETKRFVAEGKEKLTSRVSELDRRLDSFAERARRE